MQLATKTGQKGWVPVTPVYKKSMIMVPVTAAYKTKESMMIKMIKTNDNEKQDVTAVVMISKMRNCSLGFPALCRLYPGTYQYHPPFSSGVVSMHPQDIFDIHKCLIPEC